MDEKDTKICREVRAELARRGLNFTEVAKILDVTLSAVTNQLNGRHFGRNNAKKWADAFGFSEFFLITGEGALVPSREHSEHLEQRGTDAGRDGVFLPSETLELYTAMANSIQNLTELLKMSGVTSMPITPSKKEYSLKSKKI